jgi:hypothetical protein
MAGHDDEAVALEQHAQKSSTMSSLLLNTATTAPCCVMLTDL